MDEIFRAARPRLRDLFGEGLRIPPVKHDRIFMPAMLQRHAAECKIEIRSLKRDLMTKLLAPAVVVLDLVPSTSAIDTATSAESWIDGAVACVVADHYAHRNAIADATAGCVTGHHLYKQ